MSGGLPKAGLENRTSQQAPISCTGPSACGGTRIPVSVVLDNLAAGETPERILEQYPTLNPEHITAAIAYAADLARERVVPVPS